MMRERILVPLDGSRAGESSLYYVADLLSKLSPEIEREVILLQVLTPATATRMIGGESVSLEPTTGEEMDEPKRSAMEYLNRRATAIEGNNVIVSPRVAVGSPAEQIIRSAEEVGADLIAMSTHGRSGLGRLAFGSVTETVLRSRVDIPIVVVRATRRGEQ